MSRRAVRKDWVAVSFRPCKNKHSKGVAVSFRYCEDERSEDVADFFRHCEGLDTPKQSQKTRLLRLLTQARNDKEKGLAMTKKGSAMKKKRGAMTKKGTGA